MIRTSGKIATLLVSILTLSLVATAGISVVTMDFLPLVIWILLFILLWPIYAGIVVWAVEEAIWGPLTWKGWISVALTIVIGYIITYSSNIRFPE